MEGIQVSVEKIGAHGDISVIRVGGYIDTTTSSELERALDSLLKAGIVHIVIDLGNVDYISSAGWGIFISEIKGIRERHGDLKLTRMIPDVYEVFELLEFHYILKAYDTVEEAVRDFDKELGRATLTEKETPSEKKKVVVESSFPQKEEESAPVELEDKIKMIAISHPTWGSSAIAKELNTEKYGFVRMGTLSVWRMLRRMNLGTKKRRKNQFDWE